MRPYYLLDTNVISEPLKPEPSFQVMESLKRHQGNLALPAIVWHELLFGMERMPHGAKRERIKSYLLDVVAPSMPVLPYDEHAAWIHASIRATLETKGATSPASDSQIAAIAIANNMILVTRNGKDFEGMDKSLNMENWFDSP